MDTNGNNPPPSDRLVERVFRALGKDYVIMNGTRIKAWQLYLLIGFLAGTITGVVLVANNKGKFTKTKASREPARVVSPVIPGARWPVGIADLHRGGKIADATALSNVSVEWTVIRAPWDVLEPRKGQYDFSYIAADLEMAERYGKKVRLNVPGGDSAPEWLKKEVPTVRYRKQTQHDDDGKQMVVPVPWATPYQQAYAALITRIAAQFGSRIHAVAICGYDQACGFSLGPDQAQKEWEKAGYTRNRFISTATWAADLYTAAFPNQFLLFYFGHTFGDFSIAQDVVNEAVSRHGLERIGILNEGLSAKKESVPKGFFYEFGQRGGFIGYQTFWNVASDPKKVMGCDRFPSKEACLKVVIDKGIEAGAKFFELYEVDILAYPAVIAYGFEKIHPAPPSLSSSANEIFVGEPLSISWKTTGRTYPKDWITLMEPSRAPADWIEGLHPYFYTDGLKEGTKTLLASTTPGTYELRYYEDDSYKLLARGPLITVKPLPLIPPITNLKMEPSAAHRSFAVTWTRPDLTQLQGVKGYIAEVGTDCQTWNGQGEPQCNWKYWYDFPTPGIQDFNLNRLPTERGDRDLTDGPELQYGKTYCVDVYLYRTGQDTSDDVYACGKLEKPPQASKIPVYYTYLIDDSDTEGPFMSENMHEFLDGAVINAHWRLIHQKPGTFDWTLLDRKITQWTTDSATSKWTGKKVFIKITPYGSGPIKKCLDFEKATCKPEHNEFTPTWIYGSGSCDKAGDRVCPVTIIESRGKGERERQFVIPGVWDSDFYGPYEEFLKGLAAHYSGNERIAGFQIGIGHLGTWNAKGSEEGGEALLTAGWTIERWQAYIKKVINLSTTHLSRPEKSQFVFLRTTHVFMDDYPVSKYLSVANDILGHAAQKGAWIVFSGLTPNDQPFEKSMIRQMADYLAKLNVGNRMMVGFTDDWPLWVPPERSEKCPGSTCGRDAAGFGKELSLARGVWEHELQKKYPIFYLFLETELATTNKNYPPCSVGERVKFRCFRTGVYDVTKEYLFD